MLKSINMGTLSGVQLAQPQTNFKPYGGNRGGNKQQ